MRIIHTPHLSTVRFYLIFDKYELTQVQLFGLCSLDQPLYIVQEYLPLGSLLEFLQNDEGKTLKIEDLIFIAFQVADGMEYLESLQYIHRDLAARNVLMGHDNIAKICDFGLTRILEGKVYTAKNEFTFPIKWTAPEALKTGVFTTKSDVWSYGVLLMELFTFGETPYNGIMPAVVFELVTSSGYRMAKPDIVPEEIYNTTLRCWQGRPDMRPTFKYLKSYFEGMSVVYSRRKVNSGETLCFKLKHDVPSQYEDHDIAYTRRGTTKRKDLISK